jgi:4-hydroxy-tetrahydrodipicolinate synthase
LLHESIENYTLITAIGTPLAENDALHVEGLEAQIDDQFNNGITGLLVGGTMGAMQLLSDATYRDLAERSIEFSRGRGEVLVGAGDASFARTRDRIQFLNQKKIDGIVTLSPYLLRFSQAELVDYFTALADIARRPLFLYDLPVLTGTKLELDTVRTLSRHPNIAGIKCSGDIGTTRQLIDLNLEDFRVIVAAADMIDVLMKSGVSEHLDGVFAAAPHWVSGIAQACVRGNYEQAAKFQQKLNGVLKLLRENGVFATFTALMNARGIPGNFAAKPYRLHDARKIETLLQSPAARELLAPKNTKATV